MLQFPAFISALILILAAHTLANSFASPNRPVKRACGTGVDASNPLLSFLDYGAISDAADAATDFLEAFDASGHPDIGLALQCDRIRVRKEWRQLTRNEQKAYIQAEKCLRNTADPGLVNATQWNGTLQYNFADGLTIAHGNGYPRFHAGAKFLPWHRWFVWAHGYSMEKLCDYTGPIPYWDYTIDAGPNVHQAPVFSTDPEVGFGDGGSVPINELGGRAGGFIVDNGAFANTRLNLPGPHYLVRNFTPDALYNPDNLYGIGLSDTFNGSARERVLNATAFWEFETLIDGLDGPVDNSVGRGIHNSIHYLFGGDGQSLNWLEGTPWIRSWVFGPNEPLFFLHHANVDHVWWEWQNEQETYQYEFGGAEGSTDNFCDSLPLNNLGPDVPVGLALKTEWYPQCYTYEY